MHGSIRTTLAKLAAARTRAAALGAKAWKHTTTLGAAARDRTGPLTATAVDKVGGRTTAIALATAGVFTVGILLGTTGLGTDSTASASYAQPAATVSETRQQATERADRSSRAAPPKAAAKTADKTASAKSAKKTKKAPAWVVPMNVPLSSCFGPRWGTEHQGIDFAGDAGTKIVSAGAGTVVAAGWVYDGYGISVVVDHGRGYLSHYAHTSKTLVKVGQKVKAGTPLALEGSTGDSTGPHLHFEIHKGMWNQVNPAKWLRAKGVKIGC